MQWFIAEKSVWSNKGKERSGFELVSSKSLSSQFWFSYKWHCCGCWFVVFVAAAAVVVPVVVAVGRDMQE